MCVAIATNLPPILLTTFSEAFGGAPGLSDEQLGRISAFVFIGFVVGIAFASPLADKLGAKLFVVLGLLLVCGGLLALAASVNYALLLAAVLVLGTGAGTLEVVLSPIVASLEPHRRTAALNWMHSFYCVGAMCTVTIGSAALHIGTPWRLLTVGIVTVPLTILVGMAGAGRLNLVHDDHKDAPPSATITKPIFLVMLALIGLGGATEIGMAQWLPAYAETILGFSKATGGLALAGFSLAMLVGRVIAGTAVTRNNAIHVMLVCCAASAAAVLLGCLLNNPAGALFFCIALGLPVCCFWPTTLGVASDRFPAGGAFMFGLLAAFGNAGCMVMPWIVGWRADQTDLRQGLLLVAVCPIAMLLLLTGLAFRSRIQHPAAR
ncbi:MAG: hypothetical protein AMXMBFR84_44630 [Candidatus Hydrogenedentota bacterium]